MINKNTPVLIVHRVEWEQKIAKLPRADHDGYSHRYRLPVLGIFMRNDEDARDAGVIEIEFTRYPILVAGKERWAWVRSTHCDVLLVDDPLPFAPCSSGVVRGLKP